MVEAEEVVGVGEVGRREANIDVVLSCSDPMVEGQRHYGQCRE